MSEAHRFARFLLSGGLAAVVNVTSRWLLSFVVNYELAVTVAYLVGMITAFLLSRSFVFELSPAPVPRQLGRFTLVNVVAFAQVWFVSVGLARLVFPSIGFTWHPETLAHTIGVVSPIVLSYLAHRSYSFE
jgi:putative flippase GtrA